LSKEWEKELHEHLRYEPDTGLFFWTDKAHRSFKNKLAGSLDNEGYIRITFQGKHYQAHRLAWFMTHGKWPNQQIDHIDGKRSNNQIHNLRDVDNQTNACNRNKASSNNKSKLLGVSQHGKKWQARITRKGLIKHIGTFDTPIEAYEAYIRERSHG